MSAPWHGPLCAFPKFYRDLPAEAMAATLLGAGLDGAALVVRDGFWCAPATLARDVPRFLAAMRAAGAAVPYAILGAAPADLARDPTPLAVLAEHGLPLARLGYLSPGDDPRRAIADGRRVLAAVAAHAERIGIRVVVQLHHGTLHPSPSAAWLLVGDLPPSAIGIKTDAGNQQHEGWEDPARATALLGGHLAAVGVKDVAPERGPDGRWTKRWVPAGEGVTDWAAVVAPLARRGFAGPFVFSPFHSEGDRAAMTAGLAREVAHLRACLAAAVPAIAR